MKIFLQFLLGTFLVLYQLLNRRVVLYLTTTIINFTISTEIESIDKIVLEPPPTVLSHSTTPVGQQLLVSIFFKKLMEHESESISKISTTQHSNQKPVGIKSKDKVKISDN